LFGAASPPTREIIAKSCRRFNSGKFLIAERARAQVAQREHAPTGAPRFGLNANIFHADGTK
jgi:hypothetical protein